MLTIRRDALVVLLRGGSNLDASSDAIAALASMAALDLPVGRSTAASFVAIMRRKLESALGVGIEFVGWPALKASLLTLDPSTSICGVALDGGGSVVLSENLEHIVGALVRRQQLRDLGEDE